MNNSKDISSSWTSLILCDTCSSKGQGDCSVMKLNKTCPNDIIRRQKKEREDEKNSIFQEAAT